MTEADLKRDIVRRLLKEGGFARRIEDKYAIGSLDMLLVTARNVIYAEAKMLDGIVALPARVKQRDQIELFNAVGNPRARALVIGYRDGWLGFGLPGRPWNERYSCMWPLPEGYSLSACLDEAVDAVFGVPLRVVK